MLTSLDERPEHPTVSMVDPYSLRQIKVDALIAPLVSALWRRGVRTLCSCQADYAAGHTECPPEADGWAWLMLAGERDAVRLVRLAGPTWIPYAGLEFWSRSAPPTLADSPTWKWRSRPPTRVDDDEEWIVPVLVWLPPAHIRPLTTHLELSLRPPSRQEEQ